eukprot:TRINITY_DN1962_c0_g1_i1.p1 TRINITY_DN1962_c0_g1~~TRINITY_DN1962_c0_g1_i1.p1  ORF type:complete len:858 (+),score=210.02 TRINITY_DN1962_c0_g1_i1:143-2575(+)
MGKLEAAAARGSSRRAKGPKDCWEARFKGTLLERVPEQDYLDAALPPHTWMFCFPNGIKLEKRAQHPNFFIFVLTNVDGSRFYGAALTFYQPCAVHPPLPPQLAETTSKDRVFMPTCLCLLSHYQFFTAFKEILCELLRVSQSTTHITVEKLIERVLFDIPLPPPGGICVNAPLATRTLVIKRPSRSNFSLADFSVRALFDCLSVDSVINLFSYVLEEKKILFISKHRSLLTIAAETVTTLLCPFQWAHIYIPIINSALKEYLEAPTPYIMGMVREQDVDVVVDLQDVILVDLDSGQISNGSRCCLPPKEKAELLQRLTYIVHPNIPDMDMGFLADDPLHCIHCQLAEPEPKSTASVDVQIRTAFLLFFVPLLVNYRSCIQFLRKYPKPIPIFNRPRFFQNLERANWPFFEMLLETQAFSQFVERCNLQTENLFDLAIYHYTRNNDTKLSFLTCTTEESEPLKVFTVPPAATASAVPPTSVAHDTFPELNPELKRIARPCAMLPVATHPAHIPPYIKDDADAAQEADKEDAKLINSIDAYVASMFAPTTAALSVSLNEEDSVDPYLSVGARQRVLGDVIGREHYLLFVRRLAAYAHEKCYDGKISDATFDLLYMNLQTVLANSTQEQDFRAPTEMLKFVKIFNHKVSGVPEYLASRLMIADVWKNTKFWDFAFYEEVQRRRGELPRHFRNTLDNWDTIPQDKAVETESEILFKAICECVSNMVFLGVEILARNFTSRLTTLTALPEEHMATLRTLLQNLANTNAGYATQIENVRPKVTTKCESFDYVTPDKSRQVREQMHKLVGFSCLTK